MSDSPREHCCTRAEAARILGVTKSGVRALEARGELRVTSVEPGPRGRKLFARADIERLRAARQPAEEDVVAHAPVPAPARRSALTDADLERELARRRKAVERDMSDFEEELRALRSRSEALERDRRARSQAIANAAYYPAPSVAPARSTPAASRPSALSEREMRIWKLVEQFGQSFRFIRQL